MTSPAVDLTAGCVFRPEGDYWTVAYDGIVLHIRNAKGMRYLALLLARPGERFAAAELIASTVPATVEVATSPERARLAVTKRIRDAVKRIATYHAGLGYHLATTIKTGQYCSYLPDPQRPPQWSL
jgi:hypothetical protein